MVSMLQQHTAYLKGNTIYLDDSADIAELRDRGFGTLKEKRVLLSPYESFYLMEKGRILVANRNGTARFNLRDIVTKFSIGKPAILIKYLVYRDLRDRGYIVRESRKVDFEVQGKSAIRKLVSIIYEGGEASLSKLRTLVRYAGAEKKDLVLAVVDRRTDIVYYSLSDLRI